MYIEVKLNVSGKIGYIARMADNGESPEYYLQFRFEDMQSFVGGWYKADQFNIIGMCDLPMAKADADSEGIKVNIGS